MSKGFTLIEVLIAMFVLAVVVVGLFGFIVLIVKSAHEGQRRIVATALANEKMEMVRNLPYDSVGTVGGIPDGPILPTEDVISNGATYTVKSDIRYVDDDFDGTISSNPPDLLNTDYKQARIEVSWTNPVSDRPVLLITQIAPSGVEGGDSLGTLIFQALDAAGQGVAGASVHLVNSAVSPSVDLTTLTNSEGNVVVPGLKDSSGTYQLSVTKEGYTTEETLSATGTFTPDVDHSHLTALAGQLTNKTFSIDALSTLTISTVSDLGASLGNIAYSLVGSKKIGTDADGVDVYLFDHQDSTDGAGSFTYEDMTWDAYSLSIDGLATGYDIKETSVPLPIVISPGTTTTVDTVLVPHEEFTLHVTVLTSANLPIENASVHVTGNGYDTTLETGEYGQVFFSPLPSAGDYTVEVSASSYQSSTQQVTVDGGVRLHVLMSTP